MLTDVPRRLAGISDVSEPMRWIVAVSRGQRLVFETVEAIFRETTTHTPETNDSCKCLAQVKVGQMLGTVVMNDISVDHGESFPKLVWPNPSK